MTLCCLNSPHNTYTLLRTPPNGVRIWQSIANKSADMSFESVSNEDFRRLESKVDKLTDAIQRLILIEERQTTQGERIGKCEASIATHDVSIQRTDRKVDQWINRGIGVWSVAVLLFALMQFGAKFVR